MRDLNADKLICDKAMEGPWIRRFTNNIEQYTSKRGICSCGYQESGYGERIAKENDNNMEFIAQAREGWPHAIERAIKAEDRVDTLQIVAKENYRMYENTLAENARLRKVVDAARDGNTFALMQALAELDEDTNGR